MRVAIYELNEASVTHKRHVGRESRAYLFIYVHFLHFPSYGNIGGASLDPREDLSPKVESTSYSFRCTCTTDVSPPGYMFHAPRQESPRVTQRTMMRARRTAKGPIQHMGELTPLLLIVGTSLRRDCWVDPRT